MLCRVYLLRGLGKHAYREVGAKWRLGQDPYADLLMAVSGSRSGSGQPNNLASTSLLTYFLNHGNLVAARVGDPQSLPSVGADNLPHRPNPSQTETCALILLAADPNTKNWEAEQYIYRAQRLSPDNAAASFVLGTIYAREKRWEDANKALQFAVANGQGRLVTLAREAANNLPPRA
jgi:hypothetical protein